MRNIICAIGLLILIGATYPVGLFSQDRRLVILSPHVGTVIDSLERETYRLFREFENYHSASIYQLSDSTIIVVVKQKYPDGIFKDSTFSTTYDRLIVTAERIDNWDELIKGNYVIGSTTPVIMCDDGEPLYLLFTVTPSRLDTNSFQELSTRWSPAYGTEKRPVNSISLNLLGDASLMSLHYERLILITQDFILSIKFGLGYNQEFQIFGSSPENFLTVPHHVTGNWGEGRSFFELGLGGTIIAGDINQDYLFYPIIGYRLLPLKTNAFNIRIFGIIPFYRLETEIYLSRIGLSMGVFF